MVLPVYLYGHPVLRQEAEDIDKDYPDLQKLIKDMFETMYFTEGIGLAAPQIGVPVRVDAVDVDEGYFEFVNPVFVWQKGEQVGAEGCLSVRGKSGIVARPDKVKIIFYDRKGDRYSLVARGFFARAICHEFDHLDGIIYTDKARDVRDEEES